MNLFRPEAMRSQDRLHGNVDLAPPTSWQAIGFGLASAFIVIIIFLSLAHYAQVAIATGRIDDADGAVSVLAGSTGTVEAVLVKEGQHVTPGTPLLRVNHETNIGSDSLERRRGAALNAETTAINERQNAAASAAQARIAGFDARRRSAEADGRSAREQIEQQQELITSAEDDLNKAREIAVNGFISKNDIRKREETLADRRQSMSRLKQSVATASAAAEEALQNISQERANLRVTNGEIAGTRAQVLGRSAASENVAVTVVTAGADGIVSNLSSTKGMAVDNGTIVMSIVPAGSALVVRLKIPDTAVASVVPGQTASVAIDAFPYQTYGTVQARITAVSNAAVMDGDTRSFVATARLERNEVRAYGVQRPVRPGMTVTARIKTMDRTLMQWILDPLYAVAKR